MVYIDKSSTVGLCSKVGENWYFVSRLGMGAVNGSTIRDCCRFSTPI